MSKFAKKSPMNHGMFLFYSNIVVLILNYLFYAYLGKNLDPEEYSIFGVLLSFYFIVIVISTVFYNVIMKYSSYFKAKSSQEKINQLFTNALIISVLVGLGIFILFIVISSLLKAKLGISYLPVILLGLFVWSYLIINVIFAMFNGLQRFGLLGIFKIISALLLIIFGVVFISIDMKSSGAMLAFLLSVILLIIPGIYLLRDSLPRHAFKLGNVGLTSYLSRTLLLSLFLAIILNIDVVLVKYFFDSKIAGYYGAAAVIGKIPFFVSNSFVSIIFPKVAELESNGQDTLHLMKEGIYSTAIISIPMTLVFLIFPDFIVKLVFSNAYQISNLIGIIAIAMTLLGIVNIIMMYYLAIRKFKILYILIPYALLLIILLILFHETILTVIVIMAIICLLLFITTIYYIREDLSIIIKKKRDYTHEELLKSWLKIKKK